MNIFVSKNFIVPIHLSHYTFIFMEQSSKEIFLYHNPFVKTILFDEIKNTNEEFFIGQSNVYFIFVLPKLIQKGIKKIAIYDEKTLQNSLTILQDNIYTQYKRINIHPENNILKIYKNELLAIAKIAEFNVDLVFLYDLENIDIISLGIKNIKPTIKITYIGKTDIPKRILMSNALDFILLDKDEINSLITAIKKNNLNQVKSLYYYDDNFAIRKNI